MSFYPDYHAVFCISGPAFKFSKLFDSIIIKLLMNLNMLNPINLYKYDHVILIPNSQIGYPPANFYLLSSPNYLMIEFLFINQAFALLSNILWNIYLTAALRLCLFQIFIISSFHFQKLYLLERCVFKCLLDLIRHLRNIILYTISFD